MSGQNKGSRKKAVTVVAVICIIALLLAGTYTYYSVRSALNELSGESDSNAVLHDDYDEQGEDPNGDGLIIYDKDIYVENTGINDLYIRVRLEEYLLLDETLSIPAGASYNPDAAAEDEMYYNWHAHSYYCDEENDIYICKDCGKDFHTFFEWSMGNSSSQEYKRADGTERARNKAFRYQWDGTLLTDTWAGLDPSAVSPDLWGSLPDSCEVISMEAYIELLDQDKTDEFAGWILDEDGWAYWYEVLKPDQATGLLLSEVKLLEQIPAQSYFYGIAATLEYTDLLDVGAWLEDDILTRSGADVETATDNAVRFLKHIGAKVYVESGE